MNALRSYAKTQAETASPERLTVLLFEKALSHMRAGAASLEQGQSKPASHSFTKATDIVLQLQATLDKSKAPELCEALHSIYEFVALRLMVASIKSDVKAARDAEKAFAPLADAFGQAVAKVASGAK